MPDLMRAGGTYVNRTKNGTTLYLNSAICKLAVWGGAAALGSDVDSALTSIGAGGATIQAVKQIVKTVIKNARSKATKRGIRIRFSTKGKMISWGYQ